MKTRNKDMILLDLFSGTGGFHKGLTDSGFEFTETYFSEIDKHAIANYKYNFPNAKYIGSVTDILNSGIKRPDIITFGSPCQDFSLAGKRKGMGGDRSSLIEYALSAVAHFRPDVFIWENVKGTFSSNGGKDFIAILQAIADIGLYECEWQLVNTSWLLPQNRERIYLVGHLATAFRDWKGVFPIGENDEFINEKTESVRKQFQTEISSTTRTGYGTKGNETFIECKDIAGCLTGGGHSGGLHSDMDVIKVFSKGHGYVEDSVNDICPTIRNSSFEHNTNVNGIRRLTEIECERLQGFPDNWTQYGDYDGKIKKIVKTQRYKMLGNTVTAKMVQLIGSKIKVNF